MKEDDEIESEPEKKKKNVKSRRKKVSRLKPKRKPVTKLQPIEKIIEDDSSSEELPDLSLMNTRARHRELRKRGIARGNVNTVSRQIVNKTKLDRLSKLKKKLIKSK